MEITSVKIDGYGSLRELSFQPQKFSVLIGANGQGKSLIFEALNRFFADFNPVGGTASPGATDSMWFKRETDSPIRFEIELNLDEEDTGRFLPFEKSYLDRLDDSAKGELSRLTIKRNLAVNGGWKTQLIQWGNFALVTDDVLVSPDRLSQQILPGALSGYKMFFFTQNNSKDNIGGDRLLVIESSKKAMTSTTQIDDLVRIGAIDSSTEFIGQNYQQWATERKLVISAPSQQDLAGLGIITTEKLQQTITALSTLKGKFKLVPAGRDVKSPPGQRASLLEATTLQSITSMSINRQRPIEKKWEQYRVDLQSLLGRRLEPNPTQVLLKEGDLGLLPSEVGGGEQSIMGLVYETLDVNGIIAIEEPENHLHPRLQQLLLKYLLNLSNDTQVFISTHSPLFASKLDVASVFLITRDEDGRTSAEEIDESNVKRIIDELGVTPANMLEFDVIAFVEGKDDIKAFTAWASSLAKSSSRTIGFVDAEGWNSMEYYANARVLQSKRIALTPHVIFDGDTSNDAGMKPTKDRLVKQLSIPEGNIHTLDKNTIEDYLLVPSAIRRAFPQLNLSLEEIRRFFDDQKTKRNKKAVLDSLLKRGGMDGYDGEKGAQIARVMRDSEVDEQIKEIFKQLTNVGNEPRPH